MTKTFLPAALLLGFCALSPASAKDKKPADPNRKICRSDTSTGSIMPKSTCHTAAEWAAIDNNAGLPGSKGDMRAGAVAGRPGGF